MASELERDWNLIRQLAGERTPDPVLPLKAESLRSTPATYEFLVRPFQAGDDLLRPEDGHEHLSWLFTGEAVELVPPKRGASAGRERPLGKGALLGADRLFYFDGRSRSTFRATRGGIRLLLNPTGDRDYIEFRRYAMQHPASEIMMRVAAALARQQRMSLTPTHEIPVLPPAETTRPRWLRTYVSTALVQISLLRGELEIRIGKAELTNLCGCADKTVRRSLLILAQMGLIRVDDDGHRRWHVTILDLAGLQRDASDGGRWSPPL